MISPKMAQNGHFRGNCSRFRLNRAGHGRTCPASLVTDTPEAGRNAERGLRMRSRVTTTSIDRLDCDELEPHQVDFSYLRATFKAASWDDIRKDVVKHVAHWLCRFVALYYHRWIRKAFAGRRSVSRCEFYSACMVKLDAAFSREFSAFSACSTTEQIKELARQCVKRSCWNAHHELKREDDRDEPTTRLPDDRPDPKTDNPGGGVSIDVADVEECLSKLPLVDRRIIRQWMRGTPLREIGAAVNLSTGQVSRRKEKAVVKIRQCLGVDDREG